MTRPIYENAEDLANEDIFKNLFHQRFPNLELRKNPLQYRIDWSVYDKSLEAVVAMVELKCRNYTRRKIDSWGGLMVSLNKWRSAVSYFEELNLPVRFYFKFLDTQEGEYLRFDATRQNYQHLKIGYMNMKKRNDKQDMEPCVVIPTEIMESRNLIH